MSRPFNLWFTLSYLLVSIASLLIIFSISPERFVIQAIWLTAGFALLLYLSRQDPALFTSFAKPAYLFIVLLLLLTFAFGESVRGSVRWISLGGFRFQASELAKPFLILFFADFFHRHPPAKLTNIALSLAYLSIPLFLILKQPDLGTGLVILAIYFGQLLVAGLPTWLAAIGLLLFGVLARFSPAFLKDYQLRRLESFLDPNLDPLGSGYNVIQSQIAIGSGGLFGKGLGSGTQSHLRFLPERHTDFVFASFVEELGFLGGLSIVAVLSFILYYLASLMLTKLPPSHRYIAAGAFSYLLFQTFINIGMNLGLAPVTGVTLPLISYGGSSILAISLTLGFIGAIAHHQELTSPSIEIK